MQADIVWFQEANKQEALGLVKRLPEAEIARRELWPCHGLMFFLRTHIPDKNGNRTQSIGIRVQPNLYGSEHFPGDISKICSLEILPSGTVCGILPNGYLETPEFIAYAKQSQEDEAVRLKCVADNRAKILAERLEACAPFVLKWTRAVGILAGVQELDGNDAVELHEVLGLAARGLPALPDYLESKGISMKIPTAQLSEDPLSEAQEARALQMFQPKGAH